MMGNVIDGGIMDAAHESVDIFTSVDESTPTVSPRTSLSSAFPDDGNQHRDFTLAQRKCHRSKSLDCLVALTEELQTDPTAALAQNQTETTQKSSSTSRILEVSGANLESSYLLEFFNKFKSKSGKMQLDGDDGNKSLVKISDKSPSNQIEHQPTQPSAVESSDLGEALGAASPDAGQRSHPLLVSLLSDPSESYHTASESTEESTFEDSRNRTLSSNSSASNLQTESLDVEQEGTVDGPAFPSENVLPHGGYVRTRHSQALQGIQVNSRIILGRAFSCEGSGMPIYAREFARHNDYSDDVDDETGSERGNSNIQIDHNASNNDVRFAVNCSDDDYNEVDGGRKTIAVGDVIRTDDSSGVDPGSGHDRLRGQDVTSRGVEKATNQGGTLQQAHIPDRLSTPQEKQTKSHHHNHHQQADDAEESQQRAGKENLHTKSIVRSSSEQPLTSRASGLWNLKSEDEEEQEPDDSFIAEEFGIDPSSAASEQVLESLVFSSSQPSFDDPLYGSEGREVAGQTPSAKSDDNQDLLSDSKEMEGKKLPDYLDDDVDDDDDFVQKMPKSPLIRTGSRIIKKTKNPRGRPRSFHSSGIQSDIKEEIFTEMGFSQDKQCNESMADANPQSAESVLPPKGRIPLKSMKVQSLVEMDEDENEEVATPEKIRSYVNRNPGCRPKSFPCVGFFEGTDYTDLSLEPEGAKKMRDILDKSSESGYQSREPPSPAPRSLAATPSLTTPSSLILPQPHPQDIALQPVNHFEPCKNESPWKMDEHPNLEKFKAVLRRDAHGYGIRTGGNKPVTILSVVEGSVAARNGLRARDVILMLNGTNVSAYDHDSVSSFFKASRNHIEIVVLRQVDNRNESIKSIGNQIEYLKNYPALMACFLLDLTLHNKQNSLFFSMAVYLLRQKEVGDGNFQRWAYEIFSTFLDQHAPLKLQHGLEVPSITGLLSSDETSIRHSYGSVDHFLQPIIKKNLSDYLKTSGLVHEFELKNMEAIKQMKYVEKVLWKSFETLNSEEKDDKKQALAASMATFFHLVGFSSVRGGNLLDISPSFVSGKMPPKLKKNKGHLFKSEYITNMSPCGVCKQPTWNLGTTVFKCSSCGLLVHSYCMFKLTDACNIKRKTNSFVPFYVVEDPNSTFNFSKSYSGLFRSRSCQLASKTAFIGDPDLDIPLDLPPLKDVIPPEELKKLKSKELKFQEIVNELFHTERLHTRNLKVMKMLYERPMRAEPSISNITNLFFPNLDELMTVHDLLNTEFEKCKEQQRVVTKIADLLVTQFSGARGDHLKKASAAFCKDQSYALFALRKNQRKEKLAQILQDAALNPYSGRLSLKDFLPKEMQRITKYPLLIDSLMDNSPSNSEEHVKLQEASRLSRNILRHVDSQVRDCENGRKLMDLQMRLDARQLENSSDPNVIPYRKLNLTKKKLIMDGELVWKYKRAGGSKSQDLHVVMCEDILLLLVKQEGRLVLKCHTTTIEDHVYVYYPVLRLSGLLAKDAGRDKCAFYIIDQNSPQVYHLVAKTKELRNRWFAAITEAAKNLTRPPAVAGATLPPNSNPRYSLPPENQKQSKQNETDESNLVKSSQTKKTVGGGIPPADSESKAAVCGRRDSAPSMLGSLRKKVFVGPTRSLDARLQPDGEKR